MITYFIKSGDFVKIGRTKNLQNRINQLRTAFPEDPILLNACDISENEAQRIAGTLSRRANGEWFRCNKAITTWIASLEQTKDELAVFVLNKRTPKLMKLKVFSGYAPRNDTMRVRRNVSLSPSTIEMCWEMARESGLTFSGFIAMLIQEKYAEFNVMKGAKQ